MQGRIDRPDYRTAMNVCSNGFPMDTGAWTRRPGSRVLKTTRGGAPGRLMPFSIRQNKPYTLEFTDGFLRFYAGAELVTTNDTQVIVNISAANPGVFTVASPLGHGWSTNNTVYFNSMADKTPTLHNRQFKINVTGLQTFTLTDAITGDAISGVGMGTINSIMSVSRVLEIATPYINGLWSSLRLVQTETTALLLCATIPPYILTMTAAPTDTQYATFSLAVSNFQDGPYADPFTNGVQVTPNATTGLVNLSLSFPAYLATSTYDVGAYVTSGGLNYRSRITANLNHAPAGSPTQWEAVSATVAIGPNGFQGSDIGRHVRLLSAPALWVATTTYAVGNSAEFNGAYWKSLVAGNTNNQPGIDLTKWAADAAGAKWSWGKITALLNQTSAATGTPIGDMTGSGGLAAAFDGITNQARAACATENITGSVSVATAISLSSFVGKNYGPPAAINLATIFPSSDLGLSGGTQTNDTTTSIIATVTINLRGKGTAPASPADGVLLGTTGVIANPTGPVTINSTDTATAYAYVWFEIVSNATITHAAKPLTTYTFYNTCAEAQFFTPSTGTSNGVTIQLLGPDLLYTVPVRTWRLGLYSDTTTWPTCGTSHDGRMWLSGAVPNRVDASVSNHFDQFTPTGPTGAVADSNAIAAVFNASDVNPIFWLTPDLQGIIAGTEGGEWLISAAVNGPLTPTTTNARRVTKNGCANIEPQRTGLTITFVQRYKKKLLEYFADVYSGKFTAPNLSLTGRHISNRGVEEIVYQSELVPILWARMSDGKIAGVTYKRETLASSQGPNFAGWHEHTLGHGRVVTSICHGSSSDGLLDTLFMITRDAATAIHFVEILSNLWEEASTDISDAWFLDGALQDTSYTLAGTTLTITGFWPYVGKSITIWAGGVDMGQATVTATGSVAISLNALLTSARVTSFAGAMPIIGGFTFTSQGQIVRPASAAETGARTGPGWGKVRRTHKFAALLQDTQGISFGTTFAKLNEANFESPGGSRFTRLQLASDLVAIVLTDSPSLDSMICWQVSRPYPATIAALSGMLHTEDE